MSSPALKIFTNDTSNSETESETESKLSLATSNSSESIVTASPSELIKVNLYFLIADMTVPCDIYLFSQDMFVRTCRKDEKIVVSDLEKWRFEFYNIGFIKSEDQDAWTAWRETRHIHKTDINIVDTNKICSLTNTTRSDTKSNLPSFLSYAFEKIAYKCEGKAEYEALEFSQRRLKSILDSPALSWYFSGHAEEEHFKHCARTTYLTELFVAFGLPNMPEQAHETLIMSAAIHELSGDPTEFIGRLVSTETIDTIKKRKLAIPKRVFEIIEQHDEFFNGGGGPRGLSGNQISILSRIFMFSNLFDHYYTKYPGGTRRARIERTLGYLSKRKDEFDPKLWTPFVNFIQKVEIY